ncbi:DAK2 domain-containing protein [Clostridium sp. JNZ X4-2]
MGYLNIDGQIFYNMVVNASNKLEEQKEFVNSLNVFPVPDGDTGTNMSMTIRNAVLEISNTEETSIGVIVKQLAKGALMGARGNSGVILSQIFRGISKGIQGKNQINSLEFANSLEEGAKSAYKAVMRPTEGTILTIIRAVGESAVKSQEKDITKLLEEVCSYGKTMLDKTPDMLPVLKKAKVVDAGGMGLLVILQGMYEALKNNMERVNLKEAGTVKIQSAAKNLEEQNIKYGYCTEFLIHSQVSDIQDFRRKLQEVGDSMVVVKDEDIIKVHIHTNDPGWVLSQAVKLGELSKIKIDNMREQHRHILNIDDFEENSSEKKIAQDEESHEQETELKKYAFISVSAGEGINNIFKDLGVDYVIEGGQTMNPSTEDILNCIDGVNSETVFVLPNNKNVIMAANQAAELSNKTVKIIPTKTIPQGITAITAFNSDMDLNENVNAMESAISTVATGLVTYAVRDTEVDEKNIKKGDILGLIEGKIKQVGKDKFQVCGNIIDEMTGQNSELISIYYGEECNENEVNDFVKKLEKKYEDMDIQCYSGKQPLYYFIVSVE